MMKSVEEVIKFLESEISRLENGHGDYSSDIDYLKQLIAEIKAG